MVSNGRVLQQACVDFAAMTDDGLAGWIDDEVQFPATMVDRIVPTPTEDDRRDALRTLGVKDMAPVSAEPFSQWVIERFDGPRPRWDAAGAEYVGDVGPWEASKLRLLNGGHLAVAYLGLLAGATTVAEALDRPGFPAFTLRFMIVEQKPTLPASDHDIDAYARQLLQRWMNHGIVHRLERVGRDGSGKLPTRLLASLMDNVDAGRPAPCTLLAVAAWLLCATTDGPGGAPLIEDDKTATLRRMRAAAGDDAARFVDSALTLSGVFGHRVPRWAAIRTALAAAIGTVQRGGSPATMAASLASVLP
jgi:fructuronate reductase